MLAHLIKVAGRQMMRHKQTFLINVLGLSTGLACAFLIMLWIGDEYSMDAFHENNSRLYQVMEFQEYSTGISATQSTPGLLAEALAEELPEFEYTTMMDWGSDWTLSVDDNSIKAVGRHASPDFLNMFSYPLLAGDKNSALLEPNSVVLTRSTAESLFGTAENVVGRAISYEHELELMVSGVIQDVSPHSTIQFDFLLTWEKFLNDNDWARQWGNNGPHTYAMLKPGVDAERLSRKIADFVKERNEDSNVTLFLKEYSERYLHGRYEDGKLVGGRIEYVRLFGLIAIFILIIASINFMNLATAQGSKRAKEVGVRKAIGVPRQTLIGQFLVEATAIALISFLLAILLTAITLPQFNLLTDKEMTLLSQPRTGLLFLVVAIITGILAGSYPALYLSGFKPVEVLKGTIRSSVGELWARKGLVIFQFAISAFLITSVLVIYDQIKFIQQKNLGYDQDQIVLVTLDGALEEQHEAFTQRLVQEPGIVNASTIGHSLVGRNNNTSGLEWEGKNPDENILFENMRVGYDCLETMGVRMAAGRSFSRDYGQDSAKIVLNEAAVRVMGFDEPIGQLVTLWGRYNLEVIGVVEDFHFQSLHEPIRPVFFVLRPNDTWSVITRLEASNEKTGIASLQKTYEEFNPSFPFDYEFVDEQFAQLYAAERRVSSLSRYFAGVAILISCLGLFGLSTFTAQRRQKEIGVRKVLGASVANIITLLTNEFARIVLLALGIALPVSGYVLNKWLLQFEFRISLNVWVFIIAGLAVLVISYVTVSSQAYRAALVNPSQSLKDE